MIKEGQQKTAKYWGKYRVEKIVQLANPVVCYSDEKGKTLFNPILVKIEWEKSPSWDKHEFWFRPHKDMTVMGIELIIIKDEEAGK